mgnify:CR=1 FL=1|jgi:hypothetical protein
MANTLNGIEDPDHMVLMGKISRTITMMPEEIRDRFKAIKVLYDECHELEEEREYELHQLEILFEALYADIYRQRNELINGLEPVN